MTGYFCRTVFLLLILINDCAGQALTVTRSIQKTIANGTRDITGLPGKRYWQNTGNYTIDTRFVPASGELGGTVGIDYTNNSTDTLTNIVFKLYPNFYKADAMRNMPIAPQDVSTGVQIVSLSINNVDFDSSKRTIRGTNMFVSGSRILPKQKAHIDISYRYVINKGSFIRTGQVDTGAFFIAYFFPRIAVYDDVDGWNVHPYLGKEEFYNDYGNFHAAITVPANYQVWATGELQNMHDVYQPAIEQRILHAQQSDLIESIITPQDLQQQHVTRGDSTNTWLFDAVHVTDFAFATSNHYVWQACSVLVDSTTNRRTRVDAVYNPAHSAFLPVASYARKTVELISHVFPKVPFPYPHETIFEGLDAMEYPMMVNNLPFEAPKDAIEFTAHEVFHTLFPFYVASNETKYSFMDEGLATLTEFMFHPLIDSTVAVDYDLSPVNLSAGTDEDVPVMTPTPQLYGKARYADKDLKPALAYWYIKEMLGEKVFTKALQLYITSWAGKHPTPYDFFNSLNTGSGINLNWFWKNWFFEKNIPDLAISSVTRQQLIYSVVIASPGTLAVPVHLTVVYKDGSTESLSENVSCWKNGKKRIRLRIKAKMQIKQLVLGNAYDVDINPGNNTWKF